MNEVTQLRDPVELALEQLLVPDELRSECDAIARDVRALIPVCERLIERSHAATAPVERHRDAIEAGVRAVVGRDDPCFDDFEAVFSEAVCYFGGDRSMHIAFGELRDTVSAYERQVTDEVLAELPAPTGGHALADELEVLMPQLRSIIERAVPIVTECELPRFEVPADESDAEHDERAARTGARRLIDTIYELHELTDDRNILDDRYYAARVASVPPETAGIEGDGQ